MKNTWLDYLGLAAVAGVMIWLLSIAGCGGGRVVHPSPGLEACPAACGMLHDLECPEGLDASCTADCERLAGLGYVWQDDTSGPECIVQSDGTVEGVRGCNVRCEQ